MQTYLGVDIGSYSVKVVVLKASFDQYSLEEIACEVIASDSDSDQKLLKIKALRSILSSLKDKDFDAVYACLGCESTVVKRFELHNVKRGDRQKIIENEFDLLGVFDLENYNLEYHTIKYQKDYAKVLGILIEKQPAKALIEVLEQCSLSVRTIDIDNFSYLNLIKLLPLPENNSQRGVELFLDIGHSKTSFTIIENHRVLYGKVINISGGYLTKLIQEKFNLDFENATRLKHNLVNNTDNDYIEILNGFLDELCSEVKRTIKILNSKEQIKIDRIIVIGGTSKIVGIEEYLENSLGINVWKLSKFNNVLGLETISPLDFSSFAQCIGVSLRADLNPTNSKINIRHGDLALISNYEKVIGELWRYAVIFSIFFIILFSTYILRYFLFNQRVDQIKTQFKKDIVSMFINEPRELKLVSGKKNWDFDEYSIRAIKLVKESTDGKKSLIDYLATNVNSVPLYLLNEISLAIPKSIYLEVVNFKYQDTTLFFEADTSNSESVQAIMDKLKSVKMLSQIVKKSETTKAGSDGKLVHFSVSASVSEIGG